MIWCIKTYITAYVKRTQKKDILSIVSNLQPNCCLKFDFQKVDIVKIELAGPCKPKFPLLTSSFVINIHTRIKNSLLWHIYALLWYQFFKIVDNVIQCPKKHIFRGIYCKSNI